MQEVVSVIVEWLGSPQGFSGRRPPPYGWVWVVIAVIWVGGWLTAQELRGKKERLNSQTTRTLFDHELSATALIETGKTLTRHSARLQFDQQAYVLNVKITSGTETERLIHKRLASLSEVEAFLSSETVFILSDLKVSPAASA
ncbi:hypothetical protein [Stutzerimonas nitrititolerans]|uniref:hypothetical protein n=1 Tax=Stutzerimonas nitrititolerans TaxID=2482751 RepID=UPI0015E43FFC|nr:hypothetical protein [Stutzerimonas nitrititolerans]MBA1185545.1 hypothetical protein [Stutzerimonas stutzeri]